MLDHKLVFIPTPFVKAHKLDMLYHFEVWLISLLKGCEEI